jgi:putative hydrolase of the HAD superfamily
MSDELEERIIEIIREHAVPREVIPGGVQRLQPGQLKRRAGEIKAVLFDVYGTLFTGASGEMSGPGYEHRQARRIDGFLDGYGLAKRGAEVRQAFYNEVGDRHKRLKQEGIDFPEVVYEEIWAKVLGWEDRAKLKTFAAGYEMIVNPVYPMPRLGEVLAALKEKKLVMGIISNAQFFTPLLFPAFLGRSLEELGFDPDLLFYSYKYGHAKPSDFMFRQAAGVLQSKGIEPEAAVYVGNDMRNDILPARGVGFRTILFAGDGGSPRGREAGNRCRDVVPDRIIIDLKQILAFLQQF